MCLSVVFSVHVLRWLLVCGRDRANVFTTCSPQIRSLQSECEDYKTEIDLLKRRIEQLRKRRDYATDS